MDDLQLEQGIQDLIEKRTGLKTPDAARGVAFEVIKIDDNCIQVKTEKGGRIKIDRYLPVIVLKLISDRQDEDWIKVSDPDLQMIAFSENSRNGCLSYLLPVLEAIGVIEIDRKRPNKVRILFRD